MKPLVLKGKVAVVTGGARGIGRAISDRYDDGFVAWTPTNVNPYYFVYLCKP